MFVYQLARSNFVEKLLTAEALSELLNDLSDAIPFNWAMDLFTQTDLVIGYQDSRDCLHRQCVFASRHMLPRSFKSQWSGIINEYLIDWRANDRSYSEFYRQSRITGKTLFDRLVLQENQRSIAREREFFENIRGARLPIYAVNWHWQCGIYVQPISVYDDKLHLNFRPIYETMLLGKEATVTLEPA